MKMKTAAAATTLALLAGCAVQQPQMSREEWLRVSAREYDVSKDVALNAAEHLFKLADGDDFQFVHSDEGLYASRRWSIYLVFFAAFGTDTWKIQASPTETGTRLQMQVNTQSTAAGPVATSRGDFTAGALPMAGSPIQGTAIYELFWARMDYLLGKRETWMTCEESNKRVETEIVWGMNDPLCNSLNVKDETPLEPFIRGASQQSAK